MATTVIAKNGIEKDSSQSAGMTFAYYGLISFLFVYCSRPSDWTGFPYFPFAKITAGLALLGLVVAMFSGGRKILHLPKEVILMMLLFGQLCLSVPFAVWPGGSFEVVFTEFSKVIPIVILIVATTTTVNRLKTLIMVQTGSVAMIAVLTLLGISRQVGLSNVSELVRSGGAIGGVFGNPNDFAWALSLVFPLAFALMIQSRNILVKGVWLSAMIIMVMAVMRTYSRGGLISLLASGVAAIWFFGVRGRRIALVIAAVFAGLVLFVVAAPEGFFLRMLSTVDWAGDATGSAWARKHLFMLSVTTTLQHPLFGIGPGNFQTLPGASWHGTHNTFTQFSSEAGLPAMVLFCMVLWTSIRNLNMVRKWYAPNDPHWILSAGLTASFAGFIVGSFFAMAAYHFFAYFMVGFACALYHLALNARDRGDPAQLPIKKSIGGRRFIRGERVEPAEAVIPREATRRERSTRTEGGKERLHARFDNVRDGRIGSVRRGNC